MAYFECVIGSGGSSADIPLLVTCSSAFAGLTITCTDGTTTLTAQCPSSSPYEILFSLPNDGTWTVSGTISGTTYSESILVNNFEVELKNNIDLAVDFYSAANDTVSYTGIDGQTHTITTDSSGHASATITIQPTGSSLTFTSSVADDITLPSSGQQSYEMPSSLGNYSKTIALTSGTTEVYVMPDNVIYWYGYKGSAYTNPVGITNPYSATAVSITENTNKLSYSFPTTSGSTVNCAEIGNDTAISGTAAHFIEKQTSQSNGARILIYNNAKSMTTSYSTYGKYVGSNNNGSKYHDVIVPSVSTPSYACTMFSGGNTGNQVGEIYAVWIE